MRTAASAQLAGAAVARGAPRGRPVRDDPRVAAEDAAIVSLRGRLAGGDAIVALGAVDGLTARIAERAGVEALYHGGYALAAHQFGVPDVGLVGRAEVVESVRRMRAATSPTSGTPKWCAASASPPW